MSDEQQEPEETLSDDALWRAISGQNLSVTAHEGRQQNRDIDAAMARLRAELAESETSAEQETQQYDIYALALEREREVKELEVRKLELLASARRRVVRYAVVCLAGIVLGATGLFAIQQSLTSTGSRGTALPDSTQESRSQTLSPGKMSQAELLEDSFSSTTNLPSSLTKSQAEVLKNNFAETADPP